MITETKRATGRRVITTAAAALVIVGLAACSSSKASSTNSHPAQASTPPVTSSSPAPAPNTLDVQALDSSSQMSFQVSGTPHAGLVAITFENKGNDAHEMALQLMKPGATLAQVHAALKAADPEKAANGLFVDPDAEISGPSILGPGLTETATVKLEAGHYAVICFLPGPDGMPHAMMGMVGEATVGTATSDDAPPQTDGTVELTDSKINLPPNLAQGGTFAVTNSGTKPHDFSLAKLPKAGTLSSYFQCVSGSFGTGTEIDKCAGVLAGGVTTVQPGQTSYLTIQPAAGSYGYVSTQGDGADFQAGLNGEFAVS